MDEDESNKAVLRHDLAVPCLTLWATEGDDVPTEYKDFRGLNLYAQLQGKMCTSSTCSYQSDDDVVDLIESLRELVALRTFEVRWGVGSTIELALHVQMRQMGPPVECHIWLRHDRKPCEEHHLSLVTNLTWTAAFLTDLERMAYRYPRGRFLLDQNQRTGGQNTQANAEFVSG